MKRVFISHSSKDKRLAECLVDLLECMEVPSNRIFCTSLDGYGVPLGENFLDRIKSELGEDTLVLFLITTSFYSSPMCLCEMGASWVKSHTHIPVLVPPFDFCDIKGVISETQGLKINSKNGLNSLYNTIKAFFGTGGIDLSIWEKKRDRFLSEINKDASIASVQVMYNGNHNSLEEFDYLMMDVAEKLNKLPWIVRKGLYYHFTEKDFTIDPSVDEDESCYALKAAEEDYLIIDGKWVTLNTRDPKVKHFLEASGKDFHDSFEERYEICAKMESRKFWRMMGIL